MFSYIFKKDDKQITYYKPESFCPIKGPQYIEHMSRKELLFTIKRGTCSLWSIAYTDARLSYPDLTRHEIHDKMLRDITKSDKKMYYFILDYLKNIYKVIKITDSNKKKRPVCGKYCDIFEGSIYITTIIKNNFL